MNTVIIFVVCIVLLILWIYGKREGFSSKGNVILFKQPFNDAYRIFNVSNCMYGDKMLLGFRLSTLTRCSNALDTNPEKTKVKNYLILSETDPNNPVITT